MMNDEIIRVISGLIEEAKATHNLTHTVNCICDRARRLMERLASAVPAPVAGAKVEEVATELVARFGQHRTDFNVGNVADILRPYLQVSQPPTFDDGLEYSAQLIERVCEGCDCEHSKAYARLIRARKGKNVAPVSGNGTEPPRNRCPHGYPIQSCDKCTPSAQPTPKEGTE